MADYEITITMDDATLNRLTGMGMKLFAFKAVEAGTKGGRPLVWFESSQYSQTTVVDWRVRYKAYSSRSEIISGGRSPSSADYSADLGDTFFITSPTGTGVVRREGDVRAITIRDEMENSFTCGISQENGTGVSPICAFPIYSGFADVFIPIEEGAADVRLGRGGHGDGRDPGVQPRRAGGPHRRHQPGRGLQHQHPVAVGRRVVGQKRQGQRGPGAAADRVQPAGRRDRARAQRGRGAGGGC